MYAQPNTISNDTPVAMLTVGQLKEALTPAITATAPKSKQPQQNIQNEKYVFGLRGIRNLFNVSQSTAQRYKKNVSQTGHQTE